MEFVVCVSFGMQIKLFEYTEDCSAKPSVGLPFEMDVRRTSGYLPVANIFAGRVIAAICIVLFHFYSHIRTRRSEGRCYFPCVFHGWPAGIRVFLKSSQSLPARRQPFLGANKRDAGFYPIN